MELEPKLIKHTFLLCFLPVLSIILLFTGDASATNGSHHQKMVDIIVNYTHQLPNEEELPDEFVNIRTAENHLTQAMTVPADALQSLKNNSLVKDIQYNHPIVPSQSTRTTQVPEDDASVQWNLNLVNAPTAWAEGINGTGIEIALVDTGFYADHPSLSFAGGASIFDDDPWTNDHTGHGTHVAGIIGSSRSTAYPGVAPGASLYGVKVYHEDDVTAHGFPTTDVFNLTEGIYKAMSFTPDIIVIASGFSGGDPSLEQAVQTAVNQGILVVTASGNGKGSIDYPAAYPQAISVSSVNHNLEAASDIISGAENELTAPGVGITSTTSPSSPHGYPRATLSGSSQAAPHVAGVAALLMQRYGTRGQTVRELLQKYARDLGSPSLFGYGLARYPSPRDEPPPNDPNKEQAPGEERVEEIVETQPMVWTKPIINQLEARIADQTLRTVSDGGTLGIELTEDLPQNRQLFLTQAQVADIKERDLTIIISKNDWEWSVPPENINHGEIIFRYETPKQVLHYTLAQSSLVEFSVMQHGESQHSFPEPMTYRFALTESENSTHHDLFSFNEIKNEWEEVEAHQTEDFLESSISETATLGIFDRNQLKEAQVEEKNIEKKNKDQEAGVGSDQTETDDDLTTKEAQSQAHTERQLSKDWIIASTVILTFVLCALLYFIRYAHKK